MARWLLCEEGDWYGEVDAKDAKDALARARANIDFSAYDPDDHDEAITVELEVRSVETGETLKGSVVTHLDEAELYRETCFFCHGEWGKCTCKWDRPEDPNAHGFDWRGLYITKPNLSGCSRFFVDPNRYYGKAYRVWAGSM